MDAGCQICRYLTDGTTPLIESDHWVGYLSPDQGYLGHTFIELRRHEPSLTGLSEPEWSDLHQVISRFEHAIRLSFDAQVFNWVCLMNDAFKSDDPRPHVHWKVRPRYARPVQIGPAQFSDPNFAHHYDKAHDRDHVAPLGEPLRESIETAIKKNL
ncbi:MAG TPA: HIT family protein [Candidatus Saccharimonadia bacterium]|nr:HIT family protein [Candidatus Saccharimonadia bacterium]